MAATSREPVWGETPQSGPSSTSVDGYGGSTSSPSERASPEQQRNLQRYGAPGALAQLTPQEARALEQVKGTATTAKNVGYVAGLSAAIYFARRRKPPLTPLATGGLAMMGMFVGGVSAVPVGIFTGRRYLQDVDDPKHLAQVLQGAIEERRAGGIPPPSAVSGPPGRTGNFGGQAGQQQPPTPRQPAPGQSAFPGDAPFPGVASGSNTSPGSFGSTPSLDVPTPSESSYGSGWSDSSSSAASDNGSQAPGGQGQGSRWAELRGESAKAQSSWDRLRGPAGAAQARGAARGREEYPPSSSTGGGGGYSSGSGASASGAASGGSTDFMAGIEAEREKARREYEASFERERRGID